MLVFKQLSIFGALGMSVLILMGYAVGLHMNPITQSLENQDLKRDLTHTQEELGERNEEIKTKEQLVDEFIENYQEAGK